MSTAIVLSRRRVEPPLLALRGAMRERAVDMASGGELAPQFRLEALEPRRMMSAAPAALPFGGQYFWTIDARLGAGGKIYAVGQLAGGGPRCGLERFNADGSPDRSFGTDCTGTVGFDLGGGAISFAVLPDADGGCLVIGGGGNDVPVERFTADGVPDPSFNGGAVLDLQPLALANGPAGDEISGEFCWPTRTADGELSLVWTQGDDLVETRVTADGRPDEAFGQGGARVTPVPFLEGLLGDVYVDAVAHTPDGGLIVYGNAGNAPGFRIAIDSTGALSSAAELTPPSDRTPIPSGMALAGDGSTALIGTWGGEVWSVDASGAVTALGAGSGAGGAATNVGADAYPLAMPDGRVLVEVGWLDSSLVMLRADGTIDPTFNGGQPLYVGRGQSWGVALPDGSLMWVGSPAWQIQHILPDGQVIDLSTPVPSNQPDPVEDPVDPVDGGDPAAAQTPDDVPAAWSAAALDGGADAGPSFGGLFDPAAGATLFDPDGTAVLS